MSTPGNKNSNRNLASTIDHTLLKADATPAMIARLCEEAIQYHFASVCVNPVNVRQCAELLRGTDVAVCSVIGFPLGATTAATKAFETKQALADGAVEVDMVIQVGALKAGQNQKVLDDIEAVVSAAHAGGAIVKVIIETALLTDEEKVRACRLAKEAGADFVKTSTGFSSAGATTADVSLMRQTVGPELGVKAAGGIHTRKDAEAMLSAGATRIGASAGIRIVQETPDDPENQGAQGY